MKILKVTQSYVPFRECGGPAVKVRAIARRLAQAGEQVTVLTADLGLEHMREAACAAAPDRWGWRSQEDSVETVYLRTRLRYRSMTLNSGIRAFCRERLADVDVVHIYGLYDLLGPAIARECRLRGVPYIVEPMGMYRPIVRSIPLKRAYRWLLGDVVIRGAEWLIATSAQEQRELTEEGVASARIIVRRNGVEPPERLPLPGTFRRKWGIPEDARVVLYLGRLVSKKSPDLLLEAFARWRSGSSPRASAAVLVFAGPSDTASYQEALASQSKRLGLERAVVFTGPLYDDAKWAAFGDADLFVLPSQNENFGNAAAEAVACGTPVLVTKQCGIAPWVEGRAGLVVPHDCQAITEALQNYFDDADLRERLTQGCRGVARELDWETPVAEMRELYRELGREGRAR